MGTMGAGGAALAILPGIFGDGSDGDVTISSDTTLTRDMFYNNLTVDAGFTLNTGGYRIFVKGTLTNNGTIGRPGNDGDDAAAGIGTALGGAGLAPKSLGHSASGRDGRNQGYTTFYAKSGGGGGGGGVVFIAARTIVNNGTISVKGGNAGSGYVADPFGDNPGGTGYKDGLVANGVTESFGGATGDSGTATTPGGAGAAGAGGTATPPAATEGGFRSIPQAVLLRLVTATDQLTGGAGGASGAVSESQATHDAAAGGSSGGGGGFLVIICGTASWGTETADGGAKANGATHGGSATDGSDGEAGTIIKITGAS